MSVLCPWRGTKHLAYTREHTEVLSQNPPAWTGDWGKLSKRAKAGSKNSPAKVLRKFQPKKELK